MILRRISAHLREQHWTAIVIDFLIVVLGVFVGIQASNLNGERADRRLEAQYAQRIVDDLDFILTTAKTQRQFEQEKISQVRKALALTTEPSSDAKSMRLGNLLSVLIIRMSPNYESPTFSDLQNSGRMTLMRDVALRRQLSSYFSRLQYLRAAIGRNNDNYVETYVGFLRGEAIGAGYATPIDQGGLTLNAIERGIADNFTRRLGTRDLRAHSASLGLSSDDPFWARLRSALSWRAIGAAANENILTRLIDDAEAIKREVERREGAGQE